MFNNWLPFKRKNLKFFANFQSLIIYSLIVPKYEYVCKMTSISYWLTLCLRKPKYAYTLTNLHTYKHKHVRAFFVDFSLNENNVRFVKAIRRKGRRQKRGILRMRHNVCVTHHRLHLHSYIHTQFPSQRKHNWCERHCNALTWKQTTNYTQNMPTKTTYEYIPPCTSTYAYA